MVQEGIYHVYNRGNDRQVTFRDERDYRSFLWRWRKYIHPVAETFAYSLLSNHFHAVVRVRENLPEGALHRAFTNFFIAYSRTFGLRHGHHGAVFHRPFKRKEIADDDTLRWIIGYVLTNVIHHDSSADYRQYPHSSYRASLSVSPTLLARERLWRLYGGPEQLAAYLQNQAAFYGFTPEWEFGPRT